MSDYTSSFIIGSSYPVFILYFLIVYNVGYITNFSYERYTLVAPIFLGLLNVFGLFLAKQYNLSPIYRYLLTSLIGFSLVSTLAYYNGAYQFVNMVDWLTYFIILFMLYMIVFNLIVYNMDKLICK